MSEWTVEVTEALQAYRAGDYTTAQQLCAELARTAKRARVRRDAAAVHALTLLRMPARSDRLDGRTRLGQVAREDPALAQRPECLLALGIAHTALGETSKALAQLDRAAEGFRRQGQYDRLAAALAALAEAWSRHAEWETTPTQFGLRQPESREQAREIRQEQIARVRERLADVPQNDDALARVDLVLALNFIDAGDRVEEGWQAVERIASAARMTPAVADAAQKLAQRYEQQQRWSELIGLYRRLMAGGSAEQARQAERRAAEITRPQLLVEVPASAPTGQPVRVDLRVRNVDAVEVEVREVALESWLESRQGRFAEALLPATGSVRLARELATHVTREHDWWQTDALAEPLEFTAPPGAYVVATRAVDERGNAPIAKRMVVVSDLTATVFMGPRRALVWALPRATGDSSPEVDIDSLQARFWMHGSFVPTQPRFAGGVARFAVPPEAGVLRDKRWVCLVQAGRHLALCRGELPTAEEAGTRSAVALVGAPPLPQSGAELTLAGLVLGGRGAGAEWQLELRDVLERPVFAEVLSPSAAGAFAVHVPISSALADQHLHTVVRCGGEVVPHVRGRFGVKTQPAGACDLVISCSVPPRLDADATEVPVQVQAWYPWGAELSGAPVTLTLRGVGLPTPQTGRERFPREPVTHGDSLDDSGCCALSLPFSELNLPEGPRALAVWALVRGWEGHQGLSLGQTLQWPEPFYAWLDFKPATPEVGEAVRFNLDWFDPTESVGGQPLTVEIQGDDELPARLRLWPDVEGLRSEPWRPETGGTYEAVVDVPSPDGSPTRVSRVVTVEESEPADARGARLQCTAWLAESDGHPGVRVRLSGRVGQPLLVLVAADDPLGVQALPRLDNQAEVLIPLETAGIGAHVLVTGAAGEILWRGEVQPDPARPLTLHLEPPEGPLRPGGQADIGVGCTRDELPAADVALIARLVPAADSGHINWLPGESRLPKVPAVRGPAMVSFGAAVAHAADAAGVEDSLPPALVEALYAGATLWTNALPAGTGDVDLSVPLPELPGLFRLVVLARTPDGATAVQGLLLDTRDGLWVAAEAPTRLSLGDRTVVGVMLANQRAVPVEAQVRLDGGAGLQIESVQAGERNVAVGAGQLETPVSLGVPAAGRTWVQARVEAAQVGAGTLTAEVDVAGVRQSASARYEVGAAESPAADGAGLRLRRTLLLLTEQREQVDPITGDPAEDGVWKTTWQRGVLSSGQRVSPGQHLLVREEFTLAEAHAVGAWVQRAAPNCHVIQSNSAAEEHIGEVERRGLHSLEFSLRGLKRGRHTHEYHLVAVRPGVCRLPLPEVTLDGQSIAVVTEPAEMLVNVAGSPESPGDGQRFHGH